MKRNEFVTLLAILFLLGSCGEDRDERIAEDEEMTEDPWEVEEGMAQWHEAWNQNDAEKIEATTAENVTLLFAGKAYEDDSVSIWINNSSSWMKNLRPEPIVKNSSGDLAYESGTYTHGTTENDTVQLRGTYTIIWERNGMQGNMMDEMDMDNNEMENNEMGMDNIEGTDPSDITDETDTAGENTQTSPRTQTAGDTLDNQSEWKIRLMHITPEMPLDSMPVQLGQMPNQ